MTKYIGDMEQLLKLGLRRVCEREGHQLEQANWVQYGQHGWECMRCDVGVNLTYPDLGLEAIPEATP